MEKVAVVGLGYVGIPLLLSLLKSGVDLIGYDTNKRIINEINAGECHLPLWEKRFTQKVLPGKNIKFSSSPEILKEANTIIICVPTPLNSAGRADHSIVEKVFETIKTYCKPSLVILESTVSPGFTRKAGEKYFGSDLVSNGGSISLCFSPEREDPGNEEFSNVEIPKVLGGLTPLCLQRASELYMNVFNNVINASALEAAELCKVYENTFRAVNISFVNQLRNLSSKLEINFEEVIRLAKSKPFGFMAFTAGIGVGGHCIPIDPYFLLEVAQSKDVDFSTVTSAMEEIKNGPESTGQWVRGVTKSNEILITCASYKDGVSDTRCSPAIELISLLYNDYEVKYWDPNVPSISLGEKKLISLSDIEFVNFAGTVVIVNEKGLRFVKDNSLNALSIVDARYRVIIS